MTSRNDITGDKIQTKPTTKEYADGWDAIFGKADSLKESRNKEAEDMLKKLKEKENDREIQESK